MQPFAITKPPPRSIAPIDKVFKERDNQSYLEATINISLKEFQVPEGSSWLKKSAVVTCKNSVDVLLIKTILKGLNVLHEGASLLGDRRALITFSSEKDLTSFLGQKDLT